MWDTYTGEDARECQEWHLLSISSNRGPKTWVWHTDKHTELHEGKCELLLKLAPLKDGAYLIQMFLRQIRTTWKKCIFATAIGIHKEKYG